MLQVDVTQGATSRAFKQAASQAFQYELYRTTVCPTVPCLRDVNVLGRDCSAVLAATEAINRVPVPPGRLLHKQHIAFIDGRLLLLDIRWQLALRGYIEVPELHREIPRLYTARFCPQYQGRFRSHSVHGTVAQSWAR